MPNSNYTNFQLQHIKWVRGTSKKFVNCNIRVKRDCALDSGDTCSETKSQAVTEPKQQRAVTTRPAN